MTGSPHVALANWYQFMPGEQAGSARVESRMLLWCHSGSGQVWVDGGEQPLSPGSFLLLPWGHAIRYRAARQHPFLVGGAHLIPRHDGPFYPGVAHAASHPLAGGTSRRDDPTLPGQLVAGQLDRHPGLGPLVEHLAHRWAQHQPDARLAQAQGELLLVALRDVAAAPSASELPGELLRLRDAVLRHLDRAWDLARMADTAGCSSAWLTRLARRHWRTSPCRWLHHLRLEQARRLLSASSQPVTDIADAVGIGNRHRFSRTFHAAYGTPPRSWRRDHRGP